MGHHLWTKAPPYIIGGIATALIQLSQMTEYIWLVYLVLQLRIHISEADIEVRGPYIDFMQSQRRTAYIIKTKSL